jgi:hypothetical protein
VGFVLSGGLTRSYEIHDVRAGHVVRRVPLGAPHSDRPYPSSASSRNGDLLAVEVDGSIRLVRVRDGAWLDLRAVQIDGVSYAVIQGADGAYDAPAAAARCVWGTIAPPSARAVPGLLAAFTRLAAAK